MRLFNRTEVYSDGSTYTYRWYECNPFYRLTLARWSFTRKGWHPEVKRLARLRALYWVLVRGCETEICARCGHPVELVFHVPDAIWEQVAGFRGSNARFPSGSAAPGVLCPTCVSDLAKATTGDFLRWTCSFDDETMRG